VAGVLRAAGAIVFLAGLALAGRNREAAANALRSAALLALLACLFGIGHMGFGSFGLWHIALTLAVAGTLVAAAAFDLQGLTWVGVRGHARRRRIGRPGPARGPDSPHRGRLPGTAIVAP
jgi:hypothetical protein